jgi:WD40 repeat protein/predicted Ser/Thr protein kinase
VGWSEGLPVELPATLGRYRLVRLLGKGGMGSVYLAHDTQLDRPVALKIPSFTSGANADLLERFFREARAAATLSHPNICPIYDVGRIDSVYYLTMAYIEGKPLQDYIDPAKPAPQRAVASVVRQLAIAMQVAHDKGIIHRDLKPANILIDSKRQPVIMDFGLARRLAGPVDVRLTQKGVLMGTPAYMPPEQVNGAVEEMGPGCDIYSLGVILYELLIGRLPFQGPLGGLLVQIVLDPPPPPSQFRADLDPALAAICLKALAKKPADRFLSMNEFSTALRQYLRGETTAVEPQPAGTLQPGRRDEEDTGAELFVQPVARVRARPTPSHAGLRRRRPRRRLHRGPLVSLGVAAVILVLAGVFIGVARYRATRQAEVIPIDDSSASLPVVVPPREPPNLNVPPPPPPRGGLPPPPVKPGPDIPVGHGQLLAGARHRVCQVGFSADGRRAFACGDDGFLHRWELPSGRDLGSLSDGQSRLFGLARSPDGVHVLTAGSDGALRLWDVEAGREASCLRGHTRGAVSIAFSPGGRHVVSAGDDGAVYLWQLPQRQTLGRWTGNQNAYGVADFSPDCRQLVTVGHDFAIRILDIKEWKAVRRIEGHTAYVPQVRFSPDGHYLLSGSLDVSVRLWDVAEGKEVRRFHGHTGGVHDVAFSPDGRRALSGSLDKTVRLWDVGTGQQLAVFTAPAAVKAVAFSPDGSQALSGHFNGDVYLWQLPPAQPSPPPKPPAPVEPPLPYRDEPVAHKPPPPARRPVPGGDALAQAEKLIEKKYFSGAAPKTRAARLEVAAKLRADGRDAQADATTRYALWARAREVAVGEQDAPTAMSILTDLAGAYQIEAVPEKTATLRTIAGALVKPWLNKKGQPADDWRQANHDCAEAALGVVEEALAADLFDSAQEALKLAENIGGRIHNTGQRARATARAMEVEALRQEHKEVEAARTRLRTDPASGQANLTVGKFLAITQGDWVEALPLLAKSGDPRWQAAAEQDLARPSDAAGLLAVGDTWWKLGQAEQGRTRARLYWRACVWYERALLELEGAARREPEARIARVRGAPLQQLLLIRPWADHNLLDPRSGFPSGKTQHGEWGYANGRWFMRRGGGWWYSGRGHCPASFACRVVASLTGLPAEGWTLEFSGVVLRIDSEGHLHRNYPGVPGEEIWHRVLRPHGEPNDLLVVVRGRHMEIYVNGVAVCDPLILDRDVLPTGIGLRIDSRGPSVEAEFERFTLWPADDIQSLEARAAAVP